jgi:hypothetical protein
VNGLHTLKVLRKHEVVCDRLGIAGMGELEDYLGQHAYTHVIIEAPFLSTNDVEHLLTRYPMMHFLVRVHSNVGFLQVEARAIRLIREHIALQESHANFTLSSNAQALTDFLVEAYSSQVLYLPNLYDLDRGSRPNHRERGFHSPLKIGCFGARRLLKNHPSGIAASLLIARAMDVDVKIYVNVNREEHGRGLDWVYRHLTDGVPYAQIVEVPWSDWPAFRRVIAEMDLCMQVSSSETFNLVSADAAAEGVPSVVSEAIEWVPDHWKAKIDSVSDIARVGVSLINDRNAPTDGLRALEATQRDATDRWLAWLDGNPLSFLEMTKHSRHHTRRKDLREVRERRT